MSSSSPPFSYRSKFFDLITMSSGKTYDFTIDDATYYQIAIIGDINDDVYLFLEDHPSGLNLKSLRNILFPDGVKKVRILAETALSADVNIFLGKTAQYQKYFYEIEQLNVPTSITVENLDSPHPVKTAVNKRSVWEYQGLKTISIGKFVDNIQLEAQRFLQPAPPSTVFGYNMVVLDTIVFRFQVQHDGTSPSAIASLGYYDIAGGGINFVTSDTYTSTGSYTFHGWEIVVVIDSDSVSMKAKYNSKLYVREIRQYNNEEQETMLFANWRELNE